MSSATLSKGFRPLHSGLKTLYEPRRPPKKQKKKRRDLLVRLPTLNLSEDEPDEPPKIQKVSKKAAKKSAWHMAATKMFIHMPSSCSVERVFSILKNIIGDQQGRALQDYVEGSMLVNFNQRQRLNGC
jgi:hypothetical protein